MIVAVLLTLVHERKPPFGKPEVEHRVPHGQFSRSRSASVRRWAIMRFLSLEPTSMRAQVTYLIS